jgi:F-type H+-transporting ATPase subunit b
MTVIGNLLLLVFSGGGEGGGSPLDVNPGLILWTVVTFLALLFILAKFAWKPIINSLNERENFIKDSLDKAEKAQKEAEKLVSDNKANLLKAEGEAQKIIDQGREYAEKLKTQILDESKVQAKKMIEDASNEIQRKNAEAFNKLKEQVADIAVSAAEKILRENLDKEKQMKLVNKYLDELSKN